MDFQCCYHNFYLYEIMITTHYKTSYVGFKFDRDIHLKSISVNLTDPSQESLDMRVSFMSLPHVHKSNERNKEAQSSDGLLQRLTRAPGTCQANGLLPMHHNNQRSRWPESLEKS